MNLGKIPARALRAELARRETARRELRREKWRKENRCRLESCGLPLNKQESEVVDTQRERPRFPDGSRNFWGNPDEGEVVGITMRVLEECDAGHKAMYCLEKIGDEDAFLSLGPYFDEKDWAFTHEL